MDDKKKELNIKISLKSLIIAAIFMLVGLVVGIFLPVNESSSGNDKKTVSVEGTSLIKSQPDENLFYVSIEEEGVDEQTARTLTVEKSDEIVADLQEIGVKKEEITSDISTYKDWGCIDCTESDGFIGYNNLQVRLSNFELAEEVYSYLLKSDVGGRVSPSSTFSDQKERELKLEARTKAVEDAKLQAQQLAAELNAEVGDVVSVEEKETFDYFYGGFDGLARTEIAEDLQGAPVVQPTQLLVGQQDLNYSVEVVFELKD